jgi:hypothetical protein
MRHDKLQTISDNDFRKLAVDFKLDLSEQFLYKK